MPCWFGRRRGLEGKSLHGFFEAVCDGTKTPISQGGNNLIFFSTADHHNIKKTVKK